MQDRPAYMDFFEGDYLRFWIGETDFVSSGKTEQQVHFIEDKLALFPGASILDLCCGHGRHSILLAQRGYRVTGLDLSKQHLELARAAAADAGVEIEWVQADMRRIPASMTGTFDAVVNMFTSFGFFGSDAEDQKVLEAVSHALKPGGRFLIDFINREWVIRRHQARDWKISSDGALLLQERAFDIASGQNTEELQVFGANGVKRSFRIPVRMYAATELLRMIRQAGMSESSMWGDFDGSPLSLDSRRLIVLAKKPGRDEDAT